MSILINNDLIWISIPKCASTSIEDALLDSNLNITHYKYDGSRDYVRHYHISKSRLQKKFGNKETICITRNYFDRWISSLREVWFTYEQFDIKLKVDWKDLNNDEIYKIFTDDYINRIYSFNFNGFDINAHKEKVMVKLESMPYLEKNKNFFPESILRSQLYFKDNTECTHEFDITKIADFEKFIENRYNISFQLKKLNKSVYSNNNIIKDDKLKNWVWEKFEKRFIKLNNII
jgi:hypothetical protein